MITTHIRGHLIFWDDGWYWADTKEPVTDERPCVRCGRMPTPYDACLGYIEGAVSACCGHGIEEPYVIYDVKTH